MSIKFCLDYETFKQWVKPCLAIAKTARTLTFYNRFDYLKLEATSDGKLYLSAFNLSEWVKISLDPCSYQIVGGSSRKNYQIGINSEFLEKWLNANLSPVETLVCELPLPDEAEDENFPIVCISSAYASGNHVNKGGEYRLYGHFFNDYPSLPEPKKEANVISVSRNALKTIFKATSFACTKDQSLPSLTGIFCRTTNDEHDSYLEAFATDGYRMASVRKVALNQKVAEDSSFLIKGKNLNQIINLINEPILNLKFDNTRIIASANHQEFSCTLIPDAFPDLSKYSVNEFNQGKSSITIAFSKKEIQSGLARIYPFLFGKQKSVIELEICLVNKTINLYAEQEDVGACRIPVTINQDLFLFSLSPDVSDKETPPEKLEVGFSFLYLWQSISAIEDTMVKFTMINAEQPIFIESITRPESQSNLVMPVKINRSRRKLLTLGISTMATPPSPADIASISEEVRREVEEFTRQQQNAFDEEAGF